MRPSTGSVDDCFDNPLGESFFAGLERELCDGHRFRTRVKKRTAAFEFVED